MSDYLFGRRGSRDLVGIGALHGDTELQLFWLADALETDKNDVPLGLCWQGLRLCGRICGAVLALAVVLFRRTGTDLKQQWNEAYRKWPDQFIGAARGRRRWFRGCALGELARGPRQRGFHRAGRHGGRRKLVSNCGWRTASVWKSWSWMNWPNARRVHLFEGKEAEVFPAHALENSSNAFSCRVHRGAAAG